MVTDQRLLLKPGTWRTVKHDSLGVGVGVAENVAVAGVGDVCKYQFNVGTCRVFPGDLHSIHLPSCHHRTQSEALPSPADKFHLVLFYFISTSGYSRFVSVRAIGW